MLAIINQVDRFLDRSSVDCQFDVAALQPVWILDGDLVGRRLEAVFDAELLPPRGNAWLDEQLLATLAEAKYRFEGRPIHPARRAGIPRPPAAPEMSFRGVDVGCHDVRLDLSLIHISEPTRLGMISYAVFCL